MSGVIDTLKGRLASLVVCAAGEAMTRDDDEHVLTLQYHASLFD